MSGTGTLTYAATTPITGAGVTNAATIDAWIAVKGQALAAVYAPDGTYRPPPPLGDSLIAYGQRWGINWDLAAAQLVKESAGWQSRIAREKNNPAGLGAVNSNPLGGAVTFATPDAGVRAQMAHLANYARGRGDWTADDPRAGAMPDSSFGVATTLAGLDGRWAWPGGGYGAGIATLANDLLAFMRANQTGGNPVAQGQAQVPGFAWLPADADHYEAGRRATVRGGAQHYTAGSDSRGWLTTTSQPPVSAHFLVKRNATLTARGWQLVRLQDTAWTTSVANPYTVSIEYEHRDGETIPDGDYEVLAQTWVDIAAAVRALGLGDIPLTRASIKGHREWTPGTACPDGVDVDRIVSRAAELAAGATPPPVAPPAATDPPEPMWIPEGQPNGGAYAFRRGFFAHVRRVGEAVYPSDWRLGALAVFGYPLGDEYPTAGGSAQVCERYVLQWQRDAAPPWDIVGVLRDAPQPAAS